MINTVGGGGVKKKLLFFQSRFVGYEKEMFSGLFQYFICHGFGVIDRNVLPLTFYRVEKN